MRDVSVFDIIGPIMIGPSSSHTAGALKISKIARLLAKKKIIKVHFKLYGSFAKTYNGHGTDRALLGGILGFETYDYRIRDSFEIARQEGLEYTYEPIHDPTDYHPNTVEITITEEDGNVNTLRGSSVGGGEIEIRNINGSSIKFACKSNAVIFNLNDKPGVIAEVSKVFKKFNVNINSMNAYSKYRGQNQFAIIEIDGDFSDEALIEVRNLADVISAVYIKVK